jgi:hypothetical protein
MLFLKYVPDTAKYSSKKNKDDSQVFVFVLPRADSSAARMRSTFHGLFKQNGWIPEISGLDVSLVTLKIEHHATCPQKRFSFSILG